MYMESSGVEELSLQRKVGVLITEEGGCSRQTGWQETGNPGWLTGATLGD